MEDALLIVCDLYVIRLMVNFCASNGELDRGDGCKARHELEEVSEFVIDNDFGDADEIDKDGLEFMDGRCSLSSLLFCANRRVLGNGATHGLDEKGC